MHVSALDGSDLVAYRKLTLEATIKRLPSMALLRK